MHVPSDFFQVGGTLSGDAPSYVERPADEELAEQVRRGELCLVLAPRQTGKSSLMVHFAYTLNEFKSIIIDLQSLGMVKDRNQWFGEVVYQISRGLTLDFDSYDWWKSHSQIGPTQRFRTFLEDIVALPENGRVVLFFDEIDSVLELPFCDDFFTTIRALQNARASNPELRRLSFVLLGVADPASFINKGRMGTPFNIGYQIQLSDFEPKSRMPFEKVLGSSSDSAVKRIFHWTNGQPYLVQKMTADVYRWEAGQRTVEAVNEMVQRTYLQQDTEKDGHLKFIRDYLLSSPELKKTLELYKKVLAGEQIARNDEKDSLQNHLKLAGVIAIREGFLQPRNMIYKKVFDEAWIGKHLRIEKQQRIEEQLRTRKHQQARLLPRIRSWFGSIGSLSSIVTLVLATLWFIPIRTDSERSPLTPLEQSSDPFDPDQGEYSILILPFAPLENCTTKDIQIEKALKRRLLEMSEEKGLGLQVKFYGGTHSPQSFEAGKALGARFKADMVVWGDVYEQCTSEHTAHLKYALANQARTGSTTEQFRLDEIQQGKLQADIDYIIFWTQGLSAFNRGNELQAAAHWSEIVDKEKERLTLVEESLDKANLLTRLGLMFETMNDQKGAKLYYEKALAIRIKLLGEEHPETATSLNNLGTVLQALGDLQGARPYYERALAIFTKVLGSNHSDTEKAKENLKALSEAVNHGTKPPKLPPLPKDRRRTGALKAGN